MTEPIIVGKNLSKTFNNKQKIIYNFEFSIPRKAITFIQGDNGCGKSTLLNIIGAVDDHDFNINSELKYFLDPSKPNLSNYNSHQFEKFPSYNILKKEPWNKQELELQNLRKKHFGYLSQKGLLLDSFTLEENLKLMAMVKKIKNVNESIQQILEDVNILAMYEKNKNKSPRVLSGGNRQKIAMVRCLIANPSIVFIDEPTNNLDSNGVLTLMDVLLARIKNNGLTVVVVTHEAERLNKIIDRNYPTDSIIKSNITLSIINTDKDVQNVSAVITNNL